MMRLHLVAAALLVVHRVVLDVADDVLRLLALDAVAHHRAGQHRILAHVLKGAPVARLARQVHAAAQRHVVALRAQLAANQRPVVACRLRVPACGRAQV